MITTRQQHAPGIPGKFKISHGQAKFAPPDRATRVVQVQLGGNDGLNRMESIQSLSIKDTTVVQLRVANNLAEGQEAMNSDCEAMDSD
jgi:hypothetical protein